MAYGIRSKSSIPVCGWLQDDVLFFIPVLMFGLGHDKS